MPLPLLKLRTWLRFPRHLVESEELGTMELANVRVSCSVVIYFLNFPPNISVGPFACCSRRLGTKAISTGERDAFLLWMWEGSCGKGEGTGQHSHRKGAVGILCMKSHPAWETQTQGHKWESL